MTETVTEAQLRDVSMCLGFFASVIKSGEPWTATCQERYDAANKALSRASQPVDTGVEFETFCDVGYFDMWCVRPIGETRFGHGFHVPSEEEARGLTELLNSRITPPLDSEAVERVASDWFECVRQQPATTEATAIVTLPEVMDLARAILSLAKPVGGWRPIETAPKDGTKVLLLSGRGSVFAPCIFQAGGVISEEGFWLVWRAQDFDEVIEPTHWQPLPEPPAALTAMKGNGDA